MTDNPPAKTSDLKVRVLSAIVMVAIAGTALWLGGWVWTAFIALVAVGVLWEWGRLVSGFSKSIAQLSMWGAVGVVYIGVAASVLALTIDIDGFPLVLLLVAAVIATDVGAYFTGRAIGGPKIAPSISPSKTWSGLIGGMTASALTVVGALWLFPPWGPLRSSELAQLTFIGGGLAVVAQVGDFFESWLKRRAGVKDSGTLIPGHGGLFDRVDGLLAVSFAFGLTILGGEWLGK